MRWQSAALLVGSVVTGCGSSKPAVLSSDAGLPSDASVDVVVDGDGDVNGDDSAPSPPPISPTCITASQLAFWQSQIDSFAGGNRPTGSPAHEQYIQLLTQELAAAGASDVHTEPYSFEKWTPASWSLALLAGSSAGPVTVSAFAPYSGSTGPLGVEAPLAYVPGWTIPVDGPMLAGALQDPAQWTQSLASSIEATLASRAGTLSGRIVVFGLPRLALTLQTLTGTTVAVNDPGHTLSMSATLTRTDLSAMLVMPAMLTALASSAAVAAVAVLDVPAQAAQGEYAPFFGSLTPNLPALYVDRDTGASLATTIGAPTAAPVPAKLVLDASAVTAVSENLVGVLPGASSEEIVVGSHTDGPNSLEDNGPAAVLGLVQCLAPLAVTQRPRTVRVVLSGGHFDASIGLDTYRSAHTADLTANALAVMELEHLGAREWTEVSPGVMGLTGLPETQFVFTSSNAPLVAASTAFGAQFPRGASWGRRPSSGEGPNFRILPLVQFLAMPEYLLLSGLPVTQQLTDFDLMQRQVVAFVAMEQALAVAPAGELGVGQ